MIVHYGVPQIVNWIEEYENGTVVCMQLGICDPYKQHQNSLPKKLPGVAIDARPRPKSNAPVVKSNTVSGGRFFMVFFC